MENGVFVFHASKWKTEYCEGASSAAWSSAAHDQHGLGSKPTRAIPFCPWERHFTAHSPAWWSWQAVLNYSHISIKL